MPSSSLELINVYGPTECTCICSTYRVTSDDFENLDGYPPLGGPILNFSFTILNDRGESAAPDELVSYISAALVLDSDILATLN